MPEVTADADALLRQASRTTAEHMRNAARHIDEQFGPGYAVRHPSVLTAFMQTAAANLQTAMLKAAAQDVRDGLFRVAEALASEARNT
jgi:hypothetical protein